MSEKLPLFSVLLLLLNINGQFSDKPGLDARLGFLEKNHWGQEAQVILPNKQTEENPKD